MEVMNRVTTPDGAKILIEDWSMDYSCHTKSDTLAAFPVSKYSISGPFAPKAGQKFRADFAFPGEKEAAQAFADLATGKTQLMDYLAFLRHPEHAPCLTGRPSDPTAPRLDLDSIDWVDDRITRSYITENRNTLTYPTVMSPEQLAEAATYCRSYESPFTKEIARRAGNLQKYLDSRTPDELADVVRQSAKAFGITLC